MGALLEFERCDDHILRMTAVVIDNRFAIYAQFRAVVGRNCEEITCGFSHLYEC